MRQNYSISSEEMNDIFLTAYSHYAYLLGYDNDKGVTTYSGIYDKQEETLKDIARTYLIMSNDPLSDGNSSVSQYIDRIAYEIKKLGRV